MIALEQQLLLGQYMGNIIVYKKDYLFIPIDIETLGPVGKEYIDIVSFHFIYSFSA